MATVIARPSRRPKGNPMPLTPLLVAYIVSAIVAFGSRVVAHAMGLDKLFSTLGIFALFVLLIVVSTMWMERHARR